MQHIINMGITRGSVGQLRVLKGESPGDTSVPRDTQFCNQIKDLGRIGEGEEKAMKGPKARKR